MKIQPGDNFTDYFKLGDRVLVAASAVFYPEWYQVLGVDSVEVRLAQVSNPRWIRTLKLTEANIVFRTDIEYLTHYVAIKELERDKLAIELKQVEESILSAKNGIRTQTEKLN